MAQALEQAWLAFCADEVPIGAVVVAEGRLLAAAHNLVETFSDPTAHAERLAISQAAAIAPSWRLLGATLYVTIEPCFMCAGAAILARIERIVWAAPDLRHGAHTGPCDLFSYHHPIHNVAIEQGSYGEEAAWLMRQFFRERRAAKPKSAM